MQTIARITDALPVVFLAPSIQSFPPSAFVELPYIPELLLPASFDVSITLHSMYTCACESGFGSYFEEMYVSDNCVDRFYSLDEVRREVADTVLVSAASDKEGPFAYYVGFSLGWLSALALTDRALALSGLMFLVYLVKHIQYINALKDTPQC